MKITYKDYIISPNNMSPSNVSIALAGKGGSIPQVLSGMYTSHQYAKNAIDAYLIQVEAEKEVKNGKASTTS